MGFKFRFTPFVSWLVVFFVAGLSVFCTKKGEANLKTAQFFAEISGIEQPKSAVLFQNRLILTLKDRFAALAFPDFKRDSFFERQLNGNHPPFDRLDITFGKNELVGCRDTFFKKKWLTRFWIWNPVSSKWGESQEDVPRQNQFLFENASHQFSGCCGGEFGGALLVKNLKNGREYACPATCPVQVDTNRGDYFVLVRLEHMSGSCEILKIHKADNLHVKNGDCCNCYENEIRKKVEKVEGNATYLNWVDWDKEMAKLTVGSQKLLDTVGISATNLFFKNGRPHVFYSVQEWRKPAKNYLGRLENGKMVAVDSLPGSPFIRLDATQKVGEFRLTTFEKGLLISRPDSVWVLNFK